jgi:cysteine desulfurase
MPKKIYLDYAAATPVDPRVLTAMKPYFTDKFYNPSALYLASKSVKQDLNNARAKVAFWLGCRPSEIVFTAGGTEANNMAIKGIMARFTGANMVISAIEHESVREPAKRYKSKEAPVDKNGLVDIEKLAKLIDDKTVLVSIIYANNEIGTVQPIKEISAQLKRIRVQRQKKGNDIPLYLHVDAAQAGNYLDLHVNRLGVDLMTLNGGKIYGPKQSGVLYVRAGIELETLIQGGGQEYGLRSGTENVANSVGFAEALDIAQKQRKTEVERLGKLQKVFVDELTKQYPDCTINGSLKHSLPNNVSVTFPGVDNERLLMQLDEKGVMCAVGSACSASKEESSHVLKAIGLSDKDARSTIRFSMGRQTIETDMKKTTTSLVGLIEA